MTPQPPGTESPHALVVENLTKTYTSGAGDVPVLRGLSMRLRRGEWVALMGPFSHAALPGQQPDALEGRLG